MEELTEYEKLESDKTRSPYQRWTQQNNSDEAKEARFWLMKKSPIAYCVMDFLASHMDKYNAVVCSYKTLEEVFGYSRVTLSDAIKLLRQHQYIDVKKVGTCNVYLLNKKLYWNSWGANYVHAEFGSNIILTLADQDEQTQNDVKSEIKRYQHVTTSTAAQI